MATVTVTGIAAIMAAKEEAGTVVAVGVAVDMAAAGVVTG
jgi:hypothetical protein